MTIVSYLILSVVLFMLMIAVQSLIGLISGHSLKFLAGPRDGFEDKTALAHRARRANSNMIEGMVLFVPLALLAIHTGATTSQTALAGALFFFGRLAYAPLYWLGVPWLRTLAWFVSVAGIVMLLVNLLPLI